MRNLKKKAEGTTVSDHLGGRKMTLGKAYEKLKRIEELVKRLDEIIDDGDDYLTNMELSDCRELLAEYINLLSKREIYL